MRDFIKKKGIYIAIIAVIIAIISSISVAISGNNGGFAAMLSNPFFKPLKSAMTSLVDSLEQVYDYMYKYDELEAENEALKTRVYELENEYREYTEISEENKRLRALFNFSERHSGYTYSSTSVIGWTASNFSSSFTISKGTSAGIELHDCVITENGYLVGQVTEVNSSTATVTTILDTTFSVGALIYDTGDTGVLSGDFELLESNRVKLSYLDDATIIIGDTVVTSGKSSYCPKGLIIGTIESIISSPSGLEPSAVVCPSADINDLTTVYVITDFSISE